MGLVVEFSNSACVCDGAKGARPMLVLISAIPVLLVPEGRMGLSDAVPNGADGLPFLGKPRQ